MITVNLRPDLKRKRARKSFAGSLDGLRGLGSKIKDPLLLVAVVSWVGVLGWLGFVFLGTRARAERADAAAGAEPRREQAVQGLPRPRSGTRKRPRLAGRADHHHPHAWTAIATCGPTCSTRSPARCRPTPGSWISAPPAPSRTRARRRRRRPPRGRQARREARLGGAGRPAAGAVRGERAHGGHPGLHPVPPPARSLALDHRRHCRCRRRRWSRRTGRSPRSPSAPRTTRRIRRTSRRFPSASR